MHDARDTFGVNSELGRYFEGWDLETQKLLRTLYDVGTSPGVDVQVWIDGRELVFGRSGPGSRGFMRLAPSELRIMVAFPRADLLFDPMRRLRGAATTQRSLSVGHVFEVDPYVRRLVESAYGAE